MNYEKAKNMGIASLVLGISSIVCSIIVFFAVFGVIAGVVGIFLGVKAKKNLVKPDETIAFAGFVCSIVGVCLGSLYLIAFFVLMGVSISFLDFALYPSY